MQDILVSADVKHGVPLLSNYIQIWYELLSRCSRRFWQYFQIQLASFSYYGLCSLYFHIWTSGSCKLFPRKSKLLHYLQIQKLINKDQSLSLPLCLSSHWWRLVFCHVIRQEAVWWCKVMTETFSCFISFSTFWIGLFLNPVPMIFVPDIFGY